MSILIPDEGAGESNYFPSRARKFFQGMAHLMIADDPDVSFPAIVHAILTSRPLDCIKRGMESDCIEAKEYLSSFSGNNEKNISGAYDALCTALMPFSDPVLDELLGKNRKTVSIDDLEAGRDIYLQIKQEHLSSYAPIFTLMLQSFSKAFMRRADSSTGKKNRPILMLLDEFPALTYSYDMISSNLSTLRSKSVVIVLIQQNYAQLEKRYQQVGARSLIGNCNYQVILGSNDTGSGKLFSETFGMKKGFKVSNSMSGSGNKGESRSVQEIEEPVFTPQDFGDLPNTGEEIVYFKGKYCRLKRLNCYQSRKNGKDKSR